MGERSETKHHSPQGRGRQGRQRGVWPVGHTGLLTGTPLTPLQPLRGFGSLPGFDLWGSTGLSDTQQRLTLLLREYGTCYHPWSAIKHRNRIFQALMHR